MNNATHPSLSIVIPCHNEEEHIGALLRRMGDVFKGTSHEIIVVIDGCNDGSEAAVRAAAKNVENVRMLVNEKKLGKGGAIRRGILDARGSSVGFIDGDNEIDPVHMRAAFEALERGKTHIVVGNRYCAGASYHTTFKRHVTSRLYQIAIWTLFGLSLGDTQAGVKVFTSAIGKRLFTVSNVNGYAFDIDVLTHAHWMGYDIVEIPITQRFKGTSGISLKHILEMIADTCGTYDRHARSLFRLRGEHPSATMGAAIRSLFFFPVTTALECILRKLFVRKSR